MANSFAELLETTCPECGHAIEMDVWLIVDTVERTDLLERIRQGTLHNVSCPACQEAGQVDAPLLLYRPGETPLILFSPAQQTTTEQNREQAAGLVDLLRERLGREWRDEWLAHGLPSVERGVLPVVVSDDPTAALQELQAQAEAELERLRQEDPDAYAALERAARERAGQASVLEPLQAFLTASTWDESRRILEHHPELLTDGADALLSQLAEAQESAGARQMVEEHRALLQRCREVGVAAAFGDKTGAEPVVAAELESVLGELSQLTRRSDMRRRVQLCRQALRLVSRESHPELWAALQGELGNSLAQNPQGGRAENMERAIAAYEQALEVMTRAAMPVEWATTMMGLAAAYRNRIRGERAENMERAIAGYEQALEVMTRSAMPDDHRRTQRGLGGLCFAEGRWAQAATAYRDALAAGDQLYRAAATPEARQAQLREVLDLPARLAWALLKANGDAAEAILALESNRARWLDDALALRSDRPAGVPEATWQSLAACREAVRNLQTEARLPEGTPGRRDFLALSEALRTAWAAHDKAVVEVQGYNSDFLPEPDLDQVQAAAGPEHPLAYLSVVPAGALTLLVVADSAGRVEPVWSELTADDLNGLLVRAEGPVIGGYLPAQFGQGSLDEALDQALPVLGERLLGPVADRLRATGARGVTLIPSGLLGLLPLHAARYRRDGKEVCLLDEFEVAYAPSARSLGAARKAMSLTSTAWPALAGVGNPLKNRKPLAYARPELEEVAELLEDVSQALYEHDATKDRLLAALPGATHVHLSCHGTFDPVEPLDSHLQLADEELWTLREILGADYLSQARLVVLSACQTAITDFQNLPDEVIGLPAGFLQAGVVGTLWPVNDLSTMLLMVRFYRYHLWGDETTGKGPMAPAAALRRAQLWLRDVTCEELAEVFHEFWREASGETRMTYELAQRQFTMYSTRGESDERPFAHPYYWAPFVFYGC